MRARIATIEDVQAGRAVFHLQNAEEIGARPYERLLPCLATLKEEGRSKEVVVIQIEEAEGSVYVGYRFLEGGNGIAMLGDLVFPPA